MADVDLRKLRYFVAVAEHLHFGRAAEHHDRTDAMTRRETTTRRAPKTAAAPGKKYSGL